MSNNRLPNSKYTRILHQKTD